MKKSNLKPEQSCPLRIMHFWGGVPQTPNSKWLRTLRLVEKCSEQGWKNIVVFSEKPVSHDLVTPFLNAGAQILVYQRLTGSLNINSIISTYRFLQVHPCDLIHCHNRPVVPLFAAALNRIPVRIWSRLAMSSHYEENSYPVGIHKLQLNIRISCLFAQKILCISKSVQEELTKISFSSKKKSVVIGAAVDLNFYSSGCAKNIHKEFSLSQEKLILVSIGHAVPVKGWDVMLLAYSKFREYFPQSKLLLVGNTTLDTEKEFSKKIIELIETLSLNKNVILTGKRKDIHDILAAANIYIQPSRSEGLCGALIEALAAGLPCIASNVGGTTDAIRNGENGLLFEREDVDGLVKRMLTLAEDAVLREKFASNASSSVERYRLDTVTNSIIQIYKDLLSKRDLLIT